MADMNEIATLLHISEKAHAHGGLDNIAAAARNRLRQINAEHKPIEDGELPTEPEPTEADNV